MLFPISSILSTFVGLSQPHNSINLPGFLLFSSKIPCVSYSTGH
jgi:hypothetical protein